MEDSLDNKKFFIGKRFYLHIVRSTAQTTAKTIELIKLFGGQIETFLDNEVKYVLTDLPKSEWPPHGKDMMLERALSTKNSKLMSLHELRIFCSKYVTSAASSDEDEELRNSIKELRKPFIKIEDGNCQYMPLVKEFTQWPQILPVENIQLGTSIFSNSTSQPGTPTPSSQNTPQHQPLQLQLLQHQQQPRGVKRRHAILCEICNQRIGPTETIESHTKTEKHRELIDRQNWTEVKSVIQSLPSFGTLNMRRLTNGQKESSGFNHQEFLCLHKVDSFSQLFSNSNRNA